MARKRAATTNGRLEEALANLIHNQALFIGQLGRMDDRFAKMDERSARIEAELAEIKTILLHHQQTLEALPEAIRQKVGFESR
ncbi:MAG: hypothetical protein HY236_00145 [Acidobacteria bacterium]|nr:hypothetical protein [Acidobacteriota bacterium]